MAATLSPSTSPTLLQMMGCPGNDDAWTTFLRLYGPLIDERARRKGLQPADVDEIRSRVLTSLVSAMQSMKYDPARTFRGYLRKVVDHAVYRFWSDHER